MCYEIGYDAEQTETSVPGPRWECRAFAVFGAGEVMMTFTAYRREMHEEMANYARWATQAKAIEDSAETQLAEREQQPVAGRLPDPDYELFRVLQGNFRYERACRRRDAALQRAAAYGIVAMVERQAEADWCVPVRAKV